MLLTHEWRERERREESEARVGRDPPAGVAALAGLEGGVSVRSRRARAEMIFFNFYSF